jgi:hypothetical protein
MPQFIDFSRQLHFCRRENFVSWFFHVAARCDVVELIDQKYFMAARIVSACVPPHRVTNIIVNFFC